MKVVLKNTGELKEVSDGHARNYLLPRGLAVPATPEAVKQYEAMQQQQEKNQANQQATYNVFAEKLRAMPQVNIETQASAEGTLFAALHTGDICKAISEQSKIPVTEDMVTVEPIKTLGVHPVRVTLAGQNPVELTIAVIAKA